MSLIAPIFHIVRGSFHDGEGIRTVVYLKGCNLHCSWCHNPEGITNKPQILYASSRCVGCGRCITVCPEHHMVQKDQHIFQPDGCTACGRCTESCPVNALELCGSMQSVLEVMEQIRRDQHYYAISGGGVTFSGGECLLYADFVAEAAKCCKQEGISVAIESALALPWASVEKVLSFTDRFYVDIKLMDAAKHEKYTGRSNDRILENIRRLSGQHRNVIIRTPLIPQVNDTEKELSDILSFILSCGEGIVGWELLKYNPLGASKYALLQQPFVPFADAAQENAWMDRICKTLNTKAGKADFVFYKK